MRAYWLQEVFLLELTHTTIMIKLLAFASLFFQGYFLHFFSLFCSLWWFGGWGIWVGVLEVGISIDWVWGLRCGAFLFFLGLGLSV